MKLLSGKTRMTIRSKLLLTAAVIATLFTVVAILLYQNINDIDYYNRLQQEIKGIELQINKLEKSQKDFILYATTDEHFYKTGQAPSIEHFETAAQRIEGHVGQAEKLEKKRGTEILARRLKELQILLKESKKLFSKLTSTVRDKGFKDYGYVGDMRQDIHELEAQLKAGKESYSPMELMLTLRRHEKDYLLRMDLKYAGKFKKTWNEFQELIRSGDAEITSPNIAPENKKELLGMLKTYQQTFSTIIEQDLKIGITDTAGLKGKINTRLQEMFKLSDKLTEKTIKLRQEKSQIAKTSILIFLLFIILLIITLLPWMAYSISAPVRKLREKIDQLKTGQLPEVIKVNTADEVKDMADSLNIHIGNLHQLTEFSQKLGQGDYQAGYKTLGKNDQLGNSLLQMRDSLRKAQEEEQKREAENEERRWIDQGLAKFADILRRDNEDMEKLAYNLISNLTQYLEVNQGGLFIVEHNEEKESYLSLKAAYAYDRKKYHQKTIQAGEGLVGQCMLEKKTIYLKEIPNDYIEITSGLGGTNPHYLLIIPILLIDEFYGVLEMAAFSEIPKHKIEFVEELAKSIASTFSSVKTNQRTRELLDESQSYAQQMREQEEEMRQNLEELQATQEEMQKREQQMSDILMAVDASIGKAEIDAAGNFQSCNEKLANHLDLQADEIRSINLNTLVDDKQRGKLKDNIKAAVEGNPFYGLYRFKTAEGKTRYLNISVTPMSDLDGDGLSDLMLMLAINQTEQELQREQIKAQEDEMRMQMEELEAAQQLAEQKEADMKKVLDKLNEEEQKLRQQL